MARRLVTAILRTLLSVFFRRIEIAGDVPPDAPVIFAVNHPNALIDPLFLLCFAPREVSFLAKEPLFRMPLIGWFVRSFGSIPVYRRQDNVSTAGNREMFARARMLLERGGAIAIFPEGTTHSDPRLRALKTGAARIALGAAIRVSIIPIGLYYTAKQTFRSSALVYFGQPMVVDPEPVDANGEPWPDSVARLTDRIESALAGVTLQADSHAALELIAHAERIFSAGEEITVAGEFELRRRFIAGYTYLREHDPARLTRLESKIAQLDAERLGPSQPIGRRTIVRLLLLPVAMIGAAIHWPVYRLIGFLSTHFASAEDEMIATVKAVAGMLLYPLLWIAISAATTLYLGVRWGAVALALLPILGYIALITAEAFDEILGRMRALRHHDPRDDQRTIRDEILAVAREIGSA